MEGKGGPESIGEFVWGERKESVEEVEEIANFRAWLGFHGRFGAPQYPDVLEGKRDDANAGRRLLLPHANRLRVSEIYLLGFEYHRS
ncbi:hypothetical protein BT69DRAFT_1285852 [Atractiella rhizophila]|nr:hypothetical protein BT69DRAFT_1285852 [Atractiella rhizophila]